MVDRGSNGRNEADERLRRGPVAKGQVCIHVEHWIMAASIVAAVRLARDDESKPFPRLMSVIEDCVGLAKIILNKVVRCYSTCTRGRGNAQIAKASKELAESGLLGQQVTHALDKDSRADRLVKEIKTQSQGFINQIDR